MSNISLKNSFISSEKIDELLEIEKTEAKTRRKALDCLKPKYIRAIKEDSKWALEIGDDSTIKVIEIKEQKEIEDINSITNNKFIVYRNKPLPLLYFASRIIVSRYDMLKMENKERWQDLSEEIKKEEREKSTNKAIELFVDNKYVSHLEDLKDEELNTKRDILAVCECMNTIDNLGEVVDVYLEI